MQIELSESVAKASQKVINCRKAGRVAGAVAMLCGFVMLLVASNTTNTWAPIALGVVVGVAATIVMAASWATTIAVLELRQAENAAANSASGWISAYRK